MRGFGLGRALGRGALRTAGYGGRFAARQGFYALRRHARTQRYAQQRAQQYQGTQDRHAGAPSLRRAIGEGRVRP